MVAAMVLKVVYTDVTLAENYCRHSTMASRYCQVENTTTTKNTNQDLKV